MLSYRRNRLNEAKLLIAAQREVGIPTWQDVESLDEGPTEELLRQVLSDPSTASCSVRGVELAGLNSELFRLWG